MFAWLFGRTKVIGITKDMPFTMQKDRNSPVKTVQGYYTLMENTRTGKRSAKINTDDYMANLLFDDHISSDIQRWIDTGKAEYIRAKVEWL